MAKTKTVFVVTKDTNDEKGQMVQRYIGTFATLTAAVDFVDHPVRGNPDEMPSGGGLYGSSYYSGPYNVEEIPVWVDDDLGINGWPQARIGD